VTEGDHGGCAFEEHGGAQVACGGRGHGDRIDACLTGCHPQQARHLTGVRCDGDRPGLAQLSQLSGTPGQDVEAVGIDEDGQCAAQLEHSVQPLAGQLVLPEAGADDDGVRPLACLGQRRIVIDVDEDRLGDPRLADLAIGGVGGDAHDASAHRQRGSRREHGGAGHAFAARRDEQVTGVALVRIRRPAWQQRLRPARCDDESRDLAVRRGRQADLGREDASAQGARRLKQQAEPRVAEGHGDVSARTDARHRARAEIDTGRAIDRDPHSGAPVHGLDQARLPPLRCARAARPEDAVQDHGGTRERGLGPVPGRYRDVPAVGERGIRRPLSGLNGEHLTAPAA